MNKRAALEKKQSDTLIQKNTARLKDALERLSSRYGFTTVVLFGSYLKGRVDGQSDLDLYVEPLDGREYWRFCTELSRRLDLEVDVYTQDDDAQFVEILKSEGLVIYG